MLNILNITSLHSNSKGIKEIPNENFPFISMNKYVYKYDVCYMFYNKEMIYPDARPCSGGPEDFPNILPMDGEMVFLYTFARYLGPAS